MKKFLISLIAISLSSALAVQAGDRLVSVLNPTGASITKGVVTFEPVTGGVKVTAIVSGLKPNSEHGFHIHEFGDVTSLDAKSAGSHFNPDGVAHGKPGEGVRHAGDLGNLLADDAGVGLMSVIVSNISLTKGPRSVLGRAIIVHANPDDGSQPSGNAGPRIAAGTIGYQNPDTDPFVMLTDVPNKERYILILTREPADPIEEVGEAVGEAGEAVVDGVGDVLEGVGKALKKVSE